MKAPGADRPGPRPWLAKAWTTLSALALVLLLHDCTVADAERETGLTDLGHGLVLKADGTVVEIPTPDGMAFEGFGAFSPVNATLSFPPLPGRAPWNDAARAARRD